MSDISSAGVLVISPKGRILCVQRKDGRGLGLPFGKVEDEDFTVHDTAIRECREETGYVTAPVDIAPFMSEGRACFKSIIVGRTLPSHAEEGAIKWVTVRRFLERASHPEYAREMLLYFGVIPLDTHRVA